MKSIFAKIIELKDYQVLVTKEYEPEEDIYKVVMKTSFEDFEPEMKMGFKSQESCDKYFEKFDETDAELFISDMKSVMED